MKTVKENNDIFTIKAITRCRLVGELEHHLRLLTHVTIMDAECFSMLTDRTINHIESKGYSTSTNVAILFEPYPRYFGCKFHLPEFLNLVFRAIEEGQSIRLLPILPTKGTEGIEGTEDIEPSESSEDQKHPKGDEPWSSENHNPRPSEDQEYLKNEKSFGYSPNECTLLSVAPSRSHPSKLEIPYDKLDQLIVQYHSDAEKNCLCIGHFEEQLRWLCGLSRENVEEETHISHCTIHQAETQGHSRCLILSELLDFYARQLHIEISLKVFLDEIYKAITQGYGLRAVIFDQRSTDRATTSEGIRITPPKVDRITPLEVGREVEPETNPKVNPETSREINREINRESTQQERVRRAPGVVLRSAITTAEDLNKLRQIRMYNYLNFENHDGKLRTKKES
ncbi:MAG: hypothetical protein ACK5ND_08835 [Bacteroides sp.]